MKTINNLKKKGAQRGFSLPELLVVLLVISILVVLALPQVISSRRMFRFSGLQRLVAASLSEARQQAMSQRLPITFRYNDANKIVVIHGGDYGALGDTKNHRVELSGSGLEPNEIIYGRPGGAPTSALADNSNITTLNGNEVVVTFQADGSVIDAGNNPQNNALFFYNANYSDEMAFAVSVLGSGGRIKIWRYNKNINLYVE